MVDFKDTYLLFGIKFSGEHVLASILQQNPQINFKYDSQSFSKYISLLKNKESFNDIDLRQFVEGIFNLPENKNSKIIIDHCFGWGNPDVTDHLLRNVSKDFKFISILGNPVYSAAFIVKNYKSESIDLQTFLNTSEQIRELKISYVLAKKAYEKYMPNIFIIDFDNTFKNIQTTIEDLHNFLGLEDFNYDYSLLDLIEDLNPEELLGEFYDDFDKLIFWNPSKENLKQEKDLDKQLRLAIHGEFEKSRELVDKLEIEKPNNHRAAFNRGWFKMADGKLLEGQLLLDRGRLEGIFGNPFPQTQKPIWDGKSKGKVLYILEGGFGDQIHAIRYIDKINNICGDVLISCGKDLIPLLINNGYKNLISHEAIDHSYFDYWMPSMSTVSIFGYEYKDIKGDSYIKRYPKNKNKLRIGLKWSGNPEFEHEQHRKFPAELLFNAVKDLDVEYVSLQRDEEKELKPTWVNDVNLNSWADTQYEISQCDLVISSCTSVAHLSAAIGVETWIVIPILPYYLWSLPGEKTPYYNSVTLFRQKKYGRWDEPFNEVKEKLQKWI